MKRCINLTCRPNVTGSSGKACADGFTDYGGTDTPNPTSGC